MKIQPNANRTARCITQSTLALATLLFGACSATTKTKPSAGMTERHGQVQFSSANDQIVGEIAIQHNANHFRAEITKGPGVPLLTLYGRFGHDRKHKEFNSPHFLFVRATGPLAHGGWTWHPYDVIKKSAAERLKDPSRAWAALPEVFMWGEEQVKWFHPGREDSGEPFRVCLPDILMHARATNGEMKRFDYTRHEVPPGKELAARDLKKQPALETVICHLD